MEITGINSAAPISVENGQYAIDDGVFTNAAGTVTEGQDVKVRVQSSGQFSTETAATLTIGGISADFSVTTEAVDLVPDAFNFPARTVDEYNTLIESDPIEVSGINAETSISIQGGEYTLNGGVDWLAAGSTVTDGTSVVVRVMSGNAGDTRSATLTIGGSVQGTFDVHAIEDDEDPTVAIVFPQVDNAIFDRYSDTLIVRGTADDDNDIASVVVNGVEAISDDGFANWTAEIPAGEYGSNLEINATAEDIVGHETTANRNVQRVLPLPLSINDVAYDATRGRLYFTDRQAGALIRWYEPATGESGILSANAGAVSAGSAAIGTGPGISNLAGLAYDAAYGGGNGRLLYLNRTGTPGLFAVDPDTGDRVAVSTNAMPDSGPTFNGLIAVVVNAGGTLAYITDTGRQAIFVVDLATGVRSILSDDDHEGVDIGGGTPFSVPQGMAMHPNGGALLVADSAANALFSVSLVQGSVGFREVVSSNTAGSGDNWSAPIDVVVRNGNAYVLSNVTSAPAIVQVDLVGGTGDRTYRSQTTINTDVSGAGSGALFGRLAGGVAYDPVTDVFHVADAFGGRFYEVDPGSGARTRKEFAERGVGPKLRDVRGLTHDASGAFGGLSYAADDGRSAILIIDPATGDRIILSDAHQDGGQVGGGSVVLGVPNRLTFDPSSGTQLLVTESTGVKSVSLLNGNRESVVTTNNVPNGFGALLGTAVFQTANQLWLLLVDAGVNRNVLWGIDTLNNNTQSLLSGFDQWSGADGTVGQGHLFSSPADMVLNPAMTHAYVADNLESAVFEVELVTGNRSIYSDNDPPLNDPPVGAGDPLLSPRGLVWDLDRNRLITYSSGQQRLYAIDDAGNRLRIGEMWPGNASGIPLPDVDEQGRYHMIFNGTRLYSIDPETGERVIVSY